MLHVAHSDSQRDQTAAPRSFYSDIDTVGRRTPPSDIDAVSRPQTAAPRTFSSDTPAWDISVTLAPLAGLKTTGLEEVLADDGAKVGDDASAASLLSLDALVETAVQSINKGVITASLSKYM